MVRDLRACDIGNALHTCNRTRHLLPALVTVYGTCVLTFSTMSFFKSNACSTQTKAVGMLSLFVSLPPMFAKARRWALARSSGPGPAPMRSPDDRTSLFRALGQGAVAVVFVGEWQGIRIARKMAKSEMENKKLADEAEILHLLQTHPNVVRLISTSTVLSWWWSS